MTEEDGLRVLLDYFKKTDRGMWEGNPGPDPPDFIITNQQATEIQAVEHTRFFWPPEEVTFDLALDSVKKDVNQLIRNRAEGVFGVSIDHEKREAFSKSFSALSTTKRRGVSEWLAKQIETIGATMAVAQEKHLDDAFPCTLIRYSDFAPGQMLWLRSMSMGSDLGIRLSANVEHSTIHVERLNGPNTMLGELERVLATKAESLKYIDYGRRTLLVEYYASLRETLEYVMTVLDVPQTLDDVFFLMMYEESGSRIIEYKSSVSKG